jgi:hypothetical protein
MVTGLTEEADHRHGQQYHSRRCGYILQHTQRMLICSKLHYLPGLGKEAGAWYSLIILCSITVHL